MSVGDQRDERKRTTDEVSKIKDGVKTGGYLYARISSGGNLFTARVASGIKVA